MVTYFWLTFCQTEKIARTIAIFENPTLRTKHDIDIGFHHWIISETFLCVDTISVVDTKIV